MTKSKATEEQKYFLYKNGKKREVTKEEFESHFPPVTEAETETATTE